MVFVRIVSLFLAGLICMISAVGCDEIHASLVESSIDATEAEVVDVAESPEVVEAARSQIGRTVLYDPAYVGLEYPGGDVPMDRGVCTDVVVRALRDAHKMDLQKLVHEDMKAAFSAYPQNWGARGPDRNIDHRRVQNLECFFKRQGCEIPVTDVAGDYQPGDIVSCMVGSMAHIMIVSDRVSEDGVPLVIHNIGGGTREEDRLFRYSLRGHYRVP